MADPACLNDDAELLGNDVQVATVTGAVLVEAETFDPTPYINLKVLFQETGVSDTTTSIGCSAGGDTGVSDLTNSVTCSGGGVGVYEQYNYETNSYTTQQLTTWEGMTPEQQDLVSPTYYINKDGTITQL
jgi:hypothetical protein